jgi:hypothetical protein
MTPRQRKPADSRRVAAALANADTRRAYAEIVLGESLDTVAIGLSPTRRKRVLSALLDTGLAEMDGDAIVAGTSVFAELLAQHPEPKVAQGVDRFLLPNGMVDRFPANSDERRDLLQWIADRTVKSGEVLTEKQVNERLGAFSSDFALLRRDMVDFGILERSPSGSSYSRIA